MFVNEKQGKKERLLQKEQNKIDILELKKERLLQEEQNKMDFLVTEPDLSIPEVYGQSLTVHRTTGNVIYLTPTPSQC